MGSGTSDPTALYAVKIAEIRDMLESKRVEIANEILRIEMAIDSLRPFCRYIMREYYIYDKKWEQIAIDTGYFVRQIWKSHGQALQILSANVS